MTHLLLIYVPEEPVFKYPLAVPFTSRDMWTNNIDFTVYRTEKPLYSKTGQTFYPKRTKVFYGWYSIDLYKYRLKTYHIIPQLRPSGVIGYHGWRPLKDFRNKDRWEKLDSENGWILTGDNHDFSRNDLYAFLWAVNIRQNDELQVFTESSIGGHKIEITHLLSSMKDQILIDKLNEKTNPITNLNAIITYGEDSVRFLPLEEFDPTLFYNIK